MSPIMGLLPGRPPESLRPRLRRDRHDPAGRTSRIHRNPRTTAGGISVVEVNQPHRHARQRLGKSDPIDAELAARAALSHTATAVPKQTSGIVEAIRQLQVVRTSALKARHAALQQLNDLIVTAPEQLRSELRHGRTM